MADVFRWQRRAVWRFLAIALFCLLLQGHLLASEAPKKTNTKPAGKADYLLTIENELISLNAKDASIKQIVEEMGRELNIEVDVLISQEDSITVEFHALPLEDALKRVSYNYYLHFSEAGNGKDKISKIVLLPEGDGKGQSVMPYTVVGADVRVVGNHKAPGKTAREQVTEASHEKASEESREKGARPEPFKFEFNP